MTLRGPGETGGPPVPPEKGRSFSEVLSGDGFEAESEATGEVGEGFEGVGVGGAGIAVVRGRVAGVATGLIAGGVVLVGGLVVGGGVVVVVRSGRLGGGRRRGVCLGGRELDLEAVDGEASGFERALEHGEVVGEQSLCLGGRGFEAGGDGVVVEGHVDPDEAERFGEEADGDAAASLGDDRGQTTGDERGGGVGVGSAGRG